MLRRIIRIDEDKCMLFCAGEYHPTEWGQGIGGGCSIGGEDRSEITHLGQGELSGYVREIQQDENGVLAVGSGVAEDAGVIADIVHPFEAVVAVIQ